MASRKLALLAPQVPLRMWTLHGGTAIERENVADGAKCGRECVMVSCDRVESSACLCAGVQARREPRPDRRRVGTTDSVASPCHYSHTAPAGPQGAQIAGQAGVDGRVGPRAWCTGARGASGASGCDALLAEARAWLPCTWVACADQQRRGAATGPKPLKTFNQHVGTSGSKKLVHRYLHSYYTYYPF